LSIKSVFMVEDSLHCVLILINFSGDLLIKFCNSSYSSKAYYAFLFSLIRLSLLIWLIISHSSFLNN
jgi:hypothetical protein